MRTILWPAVLAPALEHNAERILKYVFGDRNERTERFIEQCVTRPDSKFCPDLARVMWAASRDLTSYHLVDHVGRLTMPTLVIWGGRDRLLPFKPVPAWTKRLPDGELEVIERCGHMPIIEDPERVVTRILAFLRRADRPSSIAASQAS